MDVMLQVGLREAWIFYIPLCKLASLEPLLFSLDHHVALEIIVFGLKLLKNAP